MAWLAGQALPTHVPHRIPAPQGGTQGAALDGLVLPWGRDHVLFHGPGSHRGAPVDVLPTRRSHSLRKYSLSDDQGAFWLVDAFGPLLERASDDHLVGNAHVQHDDAEGLPPASGVDLGHRLLPVCAHAGLRLFRLSAALEQTGVLRDFGWD